MSIALDLSEVGAISTYPQLVEAIRDMADDEGYSTDAIDQALRKVEAHLDRELRVPEMERVASLAWSGATVTLPRDFLEMRDLRLTGECCGTLTQTSLAGLRWDCGGAGSPSSYAIEGLSLRVAPEPVAATAEVLYYARIQPLTAAIQNNWVLDKHPDVYLAGALYHIARRERDTEGVEMAGAEYLSIIEAIKRNGMSARYGGAQLVPTGMRQVRGVRA